MLPKRGYLGVCHHSRKVWSVMVWAVAKPWAHAGSDFFRQEDYLLVHPTSSRGRCLPDVCQRACECERDRDARTCDLIPYLSEAFRVEV